MRPRARAREGSRFHIFCGGGGGGGGDDDIIITVIISVTIPAYNESCTHIVS